MRPYDERLDHFLSRAAKVFADQGYHSTTMRDLAAATGMSLAGMYYYVRGKEGLLRDVAPDEPAVDRSAAAYALFGMMNWIYNWYDPAGEIDPDRLAGLIARVFIGGFADARSPSPVHGG